MPALSVTFTGDLRPLEAAYSRASGMATSYAARMASVEGVLGKSGVASPALAVRALKKEIDELKKSMVSFSGSDIGGIAAIAAQNAPIVAAIKSREKLISDITRAAAVERVAIWKAEALARLTTVATSGGTSGLLSGTGHGGGISGIIRESLVIVREISMGRGMGRVGGSLSLLAQYLGVLKIAVKSTATESIVAASAADKLAASMSREALAAEAALAREKEKAGIMVVNAELNTAEAAASEISAKAKADRAALNELVAKGEIDEATATALNIEVMELETAATIKNAEAQVLRAKGLNMAKDLQVAGATAGLSLPFFAALAGIVAVAGGAYLLYRHFGRLRESEKNVKEMTDLTKLSFTEQAKVMDEAAKKHRESIDWENEHAKSARGLKDAIDEQVKSLREQTQAEIELARARGATPQQITQMELAAEREELELLKKSADAAEEKHHTDWLALQDATKKRDAFYNGTGADNATMLQAARAKAEENGKIVEAAMEAMKTATVGTGHFSSIAAGNGAALVEDQRAATESDKISFNVGDKPYEESVAVLRANANEINSEVKRLQDLQTALDDAVKNGQTLTGADLGAYNRKKGERDELAAKLGIDAKYKPLMDAASRGKSESDLSANQRIGAFAMPMQTTMVDLARQHNAKLDTVNANLTKIIAKPTGASVADVMNAINAPFGGEN